MNVNYEKRFYVTIKTGPHQGLATGVYHRNELPFKVLMKWMWYYEYRAALVRIQNPKWYTALLHGSYDYSPPLEEARKNLRNKIINKKAKITQNENSLMMAKKTWAELFPIEEYSLYQKAVEKIKKLKVELLFMETELQKL